MVRPVSPPSTPGPIAYLASQYPATSHTFIRREVTALRDAGVPIRTFSVRAPLADELKADSDRREAEQTYTLLTQPLTAFLRAHLGELARSPMTYVKTFALALRHRAPGLRAGLLSVAHFGEAILLARELRRGGISHLHNHFANSGASVGLLAARQAGIGWSFTIHGVSEFDYPAGLTLADKIVAADFVACVSYFGRAQAERLTNPDQWAKLRIVRCGLELDRLPARKDRDDVEVQIIAVGRLSPEKGFSGLLEAFARLPAGNRARLILVGDGPLRAELDAQVATLGIGERVTFLGRLPEAETLSAIADSDLLVLSSFMEGLPIVLMEALALGKPVIASQVAGIPELVRDGETGLLFAPSDWDGLARALERLVGDRALRQAMGARGPAVMAREFDIAQSATALRDLFQTPARCDSTSPARPS